MPSRSKSVEKNEPVTAGFVFLHNPRCSTSRKGLALTKAAGLEPVVVEYLKNTPTAREMGEICKKLGMKPAELVRKKETLYGKLELAKKRLSDAQWCAVLSEHPVLIERPILIGRKSAILGRPPEVLKTWIKENAE